MTNERIYAIIESGTVANTIVADDDFAEIIKSEHDEVVEITDLDPRPGISWSYDPADGEFVPPPPYPSWTYDGTDWQPPVPIPSEGGPWEWDEEAGNWVEVVPAEEPA